MPHVTISREKAIELIKKGICDESDFRGLDLGTYYRVIGNIYSCKRCSYAGRSLMGIQSHIRKHKKEKIILTENKSLEEFS